MSTNLPDSPMLLDSTGQVMAAKLEAIRQAILNSGGGGGGTGFTAEPYDTTVARHGLYTAYIYGDYCSYEDVTYRYIGSNMSKTSEPSAFDSTQWVAFVSLANELSEKPGRIVNTQTQSESFGNIAGNVSSGYQSHAEGNGTQATQDQAHAEGNYARATGSHSHAEGNYTVASGSESHAEGSNTQATGAGSHAEGYSTKAVGSNSHAEGAYCEANGAYAHAEGSSTKANGYQSHAEGSYTTAVSNSAHAEGYNTVASGYDGAHAEGDYSVASGDYSHAEGYRTVAKNSAAHAQGAYCEAQGYASHANGYQSKAKSSYSTASGYFIETEAAYEQSFGMYNLTVPDGSAINYYNAEYGSYAVGDIVRVPLDNTKTIYQCNTAIAQPAGTFDPAKWDAIGTYDDENPILFSVGNGNYSTRKNALEIRRDGTFKLNGIELPKPPSTDGTYTLQCTVSNGAVTYAWV